MDNITVLSEVKSKTDQQRDDHKKEKVSSYPCIMQEEETDLFFTIFYKVLLIEL